MILVASIVRLSLDTPPPHGCGSFAVSLVSTPREKREDSTRSRLNSRGSYDRSQDRARKSQRSYSSKRSCALICLTYPPINRTRLSVSFLTFRTTPLKLLSRSQKSCSWHCFRKCCALCHTSVFYKSYETDTWLWPHNSILLRAIVSAINRTASHFLESVCRSLRENEGSRRSVNFVRGSFLPDTSHFATRFP